jgi:predicted CXXCH cytochrome family protein
MNRTPLLLLLALAMAPARAGEPALDDESLECLGCHGDSSLSFDLSGGEQLPLFVDQEAFARSVHGGVYGCTKCHKGKTADHATGELPFKTRRDVTRQHSEACKGCHFQNYQKTLDGVHAARAAEEREASLACADCHGAHDVAPPTEPRTRVSETCARCHAKEAEVYARSVHGRAVDVNRDLPVCTDCHRAHDTTDPKGGALVLRTAEICGRCHTDEKLMKKYGISPNVVSTYLADFHGMATSLQQGARRGEGVRLAAGCTDCHGVHDIEKADSPGSSVMATNLQRTCARCHEGATAAFPAAWLSHYEPTLEKAPLVWAVQLFYKVLIPFMIGGLLLQIALHLWRVVVNR